MEETTDRLLLHKVLILLIKVIPMVLALLAVLNTVLSYFYIDLPILSYIGGVSVLSLAFFYISSYVFKFCEYHRMFLHYITLNWVLNIIDYYWGIPVSDKGLFLIYISIAGIFLFIILYLYLKSRKKKHSKRYVICDRHQKILGYCLPFHFN
jgi:hypothetical protein